MLDYLLALLPQEEIGWKEIGERFTRYTLAKTPWFRVYLHRLDAPVWHPQGHDHPWDFVAILLRRGYIEKTSEGIFRRRAGAVLFRPAEFVHNVITDGGTSWSVIVTGRKRRDWSFVDMEDHDGRARDSDSPAASVSAG